MHWIGKWEWNLPCQKVETQSLLLVSKMVRFAEPKFY